MNIKIARGIFLGCLNQINHFSFAKDIGVNLREKYL